MVQFDQIQEALAFIRQRKADPVKTAIILGSGLGEIADAVENAVSLDFSEIPHFPVSTVAGHHGRLVLGTLCGQQVAVMRGRVHYYEGYTIQEVTFPVRLLRALGAETLVVTNSCGGINPKLQPGDMMVISDHINGMGANPLIGPNDERFGVRFPGMALAYDAELQALMHEVAAKLNYKLQDGVYMALTGPTFETPAEVRYYQTIGADALGMSTVPEVIVARHGGMRVVGLACITNILHDGPSHEGHHEVLDMASRTGPKMRDVLMGLLRSMTAVAR